MVLLGQPLDLDHTGGSQSSWGGLDWMMWSNSCNPPVLMITESSGCELPQIQEMLWYYLRPSTLSTRFFKVCFM